MNLKRFLKHKYQKITRGFSDDETWSLNYTIAKFVVPRLKRFKNLNFGHPSTITEDEWNTILDKIINSLEKEIAFCESNEPDFDEEANYDYGLSYQNRRKYHKEKQEGYELFGQWFDNLWW